MKNVEQLAEARGHDIVWDYVEDTRAHGACRACGRKVRITRPYGEGVTVKGDLLRVDCEVVGASGSDA